MNRCKVCANVDNEYCFACDNGNQFKPMTNADSIRSMTDEELAHLLHTAEEHIFGGNLWNYEEWRKWLKSPVEEGDNGT